LHITTITGKTTYLYFQRRRKHSPPGLSDPLEELLTYHTAPSYTPKKKIQIIFGKCLRSLEV